VSTVSWARQHHFSIINWWSVCLQVQSRTTGDTRSYYYCSIVAACLLFVLLDGYLQSYVDVKAFLFSDHLLLALWYTLLVRLHLRHRLIDWLIANWTCVVCLYGWEGTDSCTIVLGGCLISQNVTTHVLRWSFRSLVKFNPLSDREYWAELSVIYLCIQANCCPRSLTHSQVYVVFACFSVHFPAGTTRIAITCGLILGSVEIHEEPLIWRWWGC